MHHDQAMKIVNDLSEKWVLAYNSGNAKGVAACYADNAFFNSGMVGIVKGRDNIEKAMVAMIARGVTMKVSPEDVTQLNDDQFSAVGHFSAQGPDGKTAFKGNWGGTYVKNRDEWHMVLHVSNLTPPTYLTRI